MLYKEMNDGRKIPMLGLGCFKAAEDECVKAVEAAISVGYRHIDTANMYENEQYVGRESATAGRPFRAVVVSKIWPTSFNDPKKAVEYSMKALNIDYIDNYLLHWPGGTKDARYRAWEALLDYQEKGYFKGVGVSNFKKEHLMDLKDKFGVDPCMNEIELSPWNQKQEDYAYCQAHNIVMSASVPFAKGDVLKDPVLMDIAAQHGKEVGQVVLRWNLQRGNCVIPKSSKPSRIESNFQVFDFELTQQDMDRIAELDYGKCYCSDSSVFNGGFWHIEEALLK